MPEMDYEELSVFIAEFLMKRGLFDEFIEELKNRGFNPIREGFFEEEE